MQNLKSFTTLRRFVRERAPQERCEICGAPISEDHPHLFEPSSRQLICACNSCLISMGNGAGTPYRRVPDRIRFLSDFQLGDEQWDSLLVPVGMAFFFYSSPAGRMMAFYPSPAGATESLLSLEMWAEIVKDNPALQDMEPDVEALLVNRLRSAADDRSGSRSAADDKGTQEYYLVPIDKCYELVGMIRTGWRGLSGGSEVWEEIEKFYAKLKEQSVNREKGLRA